MHGRPAWIDGERHVLAAPSPLPRLRAARSLTPPSLSTQHTPSQDAFSPGPGTYERAGNIYASLVGSLVRHERRRKAGGEEAEGDDDDDDNAAAAAPTTLKPLLAVTSARALPLARSGKDDDPQHTPSPIVVPKPGDVVTGRVTRVGPSAAQVALLCVGGSSNAATTATTTRPLPTFPTSSAPYPGNASASSAPGAFRGVVRKQDVRRTDVDGVVMRDCFRPGDVVRCAVLSLGDSRAYFLSTAANELGVVGARSGTSGEAMVPVSWQEMACPLTGVVEKRKVAKVG